MYKLTLTNSERQAIDFVGGRYPHGHDLFKLLMSCDFENDWDCEGDITFTMPEHVAWAIDGLAEEGEHQWALFSSDFAWKMENFLMQIV
jgi:hypothetical protein